MIHRRSEIGDIDIVSEGSEILVKVDGLTIAKRGPEDWISLEPGWSVKDCFDEDDAWSIEVSFESVTLH